MTQRRLKNWYLALAALTTYATTCFLYYLFFLLRDRFNFGNRENLWLTALYGFIYIFSAWQCGKFAQRHGFFLSLKLGLGGLLLVMILGGLVQYSVAGIIAVLIVYSIVLLFIWPALEALVSENETRAGVQHYVGVYNYTWAGSAAVAYFTGGKLYDWLGAGAVFWLPAAMFGAQFVCIFWLERQAAAFKSRPAAAQEPAPPHPEPAAFRQPIRPETFLKMAWLANPFAYVAVNTVFAVMPGVAEKLGLSPTRVGLFCSAWLFARLGAFILLWKWTGWHYRFRWLLSAFLLLIGSFAALLLARQLWLLVLSQVFFGFATGLIYYSSLFYSMDVGEAQAEHGGLHEAAIGIGVCVGPAVGAAALQFLPEYPNAGVYAVSSLLVCGLAALIGLRTRK
jgi:predicted MFS family arabinose efflux permease